MSLLQDLEEKYHTLQDRCSDLEADKAKLQVCQKFAEELLKAGRDEYRGKPSVSKELIMQHICKQVCVVFYVVPLNSLLTGMLIQLCTHDWNFSKFSFVIKQNVSPICG